MLATRTLWSARLAFHLAAAGRNSHWMPMMARATNPTHMALHVTLRGSHESPKGVIGTANGSQSVLSKGIPEAVGCPRRSPSGHEGGGDGAWGRPSKPEGAPRGAIPTGHMQNLQHATAPTVGSAQPLVLLFESAVALAQLIDLTLEVRYLLDDLANQLAA